MMMGEQARVTTQRSAAAPNASRDRAKILLVDDLPENLLALEALLRSQDVELLRAASGREALELLLGNEVAVALVDVNMPGMNGFELAELMRGAERTKRVPIIFITAGEQNLQRIFRGYEAGAVDFLFKPVEPRILRGKVSTFLELYRQRREAADAAEAERQARHRIASLQEVTAAFVRSLTPTEITQVAIRVGMEAMGAVGGVLFRLDESEGLLEMVGAAGLEAREEALGERVRLDARLAVAETIRRRAPIFVESEDEWLAAYPEVSGKQPGAAGTRALLPLQGDARIVGALGFRFSSWRRLSEEERGFSIALADQCAQALERARLFEAEQQARRELSGERDFTSSVLDTLGALVVVLDRDGRVVRWNPACARVTGFDTGAVQGARLLERLFPPEDRAAAEVAFRCGEGRGPETYEGEILTRTGQRRWIAWSNTVIRDRAGAVRFLVGTGIDITERRRTEAERERLYVEAQRAVRTREEFISMASHDLRNPLNAVHLQLELVIRQAQRGDPSLLAPSWVEERLRRAHGGIERTVQLMDDLLEQSRTASGTFDLHLTEVDLFATVEELLARSRESFERARCAVRLEGEGPVVGRWDRLRLEQALSNLLSNAMKYGAGAPIVVRVEVDGAHARLHVRDGGVGIAREDQPHIFDKFRRASEEARDESYGLGLWIVQSIASALGGQISVESALGAGATFTLTLPLAGPTVA